MKRFFKLLTLAGMLCAGSALAQSVGTVALSASAATVKPGGTVTLTWSTTPTVDGTASSGCVGSWASGALAAGGSAVVTVTAATTYTVTCTWDNLTADLSWTAPTQNTDGSAIAGAQLPLTYTVNAGASGKETVLKSGIAATTYTDQRTADGTVCYTVVAVDAIAADSPSDPTNELCATFAKATAQASQSVTLLSTKPNAPTGFVIR